MGVYVHGELLYGFLDEGPNEQLFTLIKQQLPEDTDLSFSELHYDLQERYDVHLLSIAGGEVLGLYAYTTSTSSKGWSTKRIPEHYLHKEEEYRGRICEFLEALEIDSTEYLPGWYIVGYFD